MAPKGKSEKKFFKPPKGSTETLDLIKLFRTEWAKDSYRNYKRCLSIIDALITGCPEHEVSMRLRRSKVYIMLRRFQEAYKDALFVTEGTECATSRFLIGVSVYGMIEENRRQDAGKNLDSHVRTCGEGFRRALQLQSNIVEKCEDKYFKEMYMKWVNENRLQVAHGIGVARAVVSDAEASLSSATNEQTAEQSQNFAKYFESERAKKDSGLGSTLVQSSPQSPMTLAANLSGPMADAEMLFMREVVVSFALLQNGVGALMTDFEKHNQELVMGNDITQFPSLDHLRYFLVRFQRCILPESFSVLWDGVAWEDALGSSPAPQQEDDSNDYNNASTTSGKNNKKKKKQKNRGSNHGTSFGSNAASIARSREVLRSGLVGNTESQQQRNNNNTLVSQEDELSMEQLVAALEALRGSFDHVELLSVTDTTGILAFCSSLSHMLEECIAGHHYLRLPNIRTSVLLCLSVIRQFPELVPPATSPQLVRALMTQLYATVALRVREHANPSDMSEIVDLLESEFNSHRNGEKKGKEEEEGNSIDKKCLNVGAQIVEAAQMMRKEALDVAPEVQKLPSDTPSMNVFKLVGHMCRDVVNESVAPLRTNKIFAEAERLRAQSQSSTPGLADGGDERQQQENKSSNVGNTAEGEIQGKRNSRRGKHNNKNISDGSEGAVVFEDVVQRPIFAPVSLLSRHEYDALEMRWKGMSEEERRAVLTLDMREDILPMLGDKSLVPPSMRSALEAISDENLDLFARRHQLIECVGDEETADDISGGRRSRRSSTHSSSISRNAGKLPIPGAPEFIQLIETSQTRCIPVELQDELELLLDDVDGLLRGRGRDVNCSSHINSEHASSWRDDAMKVIFETNMFGWESDRSGYDALDPERTIRYMLPRPGDKVTTKNTEEMVWRMAKPVRKGLRPCYGTADILPVSETNNNNRDVATYEQQCFTKEAIFFIPRASTDDEADDNKFGNKRGRKRGASASAGAVDGPDNIWWSSREKGVYVSRACALLCHEGLREYNSQEDAGSGAGDSNSGVTQKSKKKKKKQNQQQIQHQHQHAQSTLANAPPEVHFVGVGMLYNECGTEADIGHHDCKLCNDKILWNPPTLTKDVEQAIPAVNTTNLASSRVTKGGTKGSNKSNKGSGNNNKASNSSGAIVTDDRETVKQVELLEETTDNPDPDDMLPWWKVSVQSWFLEILRDSGSGLDAAASSAAASTPTELDLELAAKVKFAEAMNALGQAKMQFWQTAARRQFVMVLNKVKAWLQQGIVTSRTSRSGSRGFGRNIEDNHTEVNESITFKEGQAASAALILLMHVITCTRESFDDVRGTEKEEELGMEILEMLLGGSSTTRRIRHDDDDNRSEPDSDDASASGSHSGTDSESNIFEQAGGAVGLYGIVVQYHECSIALHELARQRAEANDELSRYETQFSEHFQSSQYKTNVNLSELMENGNSLGDLERDRLLAANQELRSAIVTLDKNYAQYDAQLTSILQDTLVLLGPRMQKVRALAEELLIASPVAYAQEVASRDKNPRSKNQSYRPVPESDDVVSVKMLEIMRNVETKGAKRAQEVMKDLKDRYPVAVSTLEFIMYQQDELSLVEREGDDVDTQRARVEKRTNKKNYQILIDVLCASDNGRTGITLSLSADAMRVLSVLSPSTSSFQQRKGYGESSGYSNIINRMLPWGSNHEEVDENWQEQNDMATTRSRMVSQVEKMARRFEMHMNSKDKEKEKGTLGPMGGDVLKDLWLRVNNDFTIAARNEKYGSIAHRDVARWSTVLASALHRKYQMWYAVLARAVEGKLWRQIAEERFRISQEELLMSLDVEDAAAKAKRAAAAQVKKKRADAAAAAAAALAKIAEEKAVLEAEKAKAVVEAAKAKALIHAKRMAKAREEAEASAAIEYLKMQAAVEAAEAKSALEASAAIEAREEAKAQAAAIASVQAAEEEEAEAKAAELASKKAAAEFEAAKAREKAEFEAAKAREKEERGNDDEEDDDDDEDGDISSSEEDDDDDEEDDDAIDERARAAAEWSKHVDEMNRKHEEEERLDQAKRENERAVAVEKLLAKKSAAVAAATAQGGSGSIGEEVNAEALWESGDGVLDADVDAILNVIGHDSGFSPAQVRVALIKANCNIDRATLILMGLEVEEETPAASATMPRNSSVGHSSELVAGNGDQNWNTAGKNVKRDNKRSLSRTNSATSAHEASVQQQQHVSKQAPSGDNTRTPPQQQYQQQQYQYPAHPGPMPAPQQPPHLMPGLAGTPQPHPVQSQPYQAYPGTAYDGQFVNYPSGPPPAAHQQPPLPPPGQHGAQVPPPTGWQPTGPLRGQFDLAPPGTGRPLSGGGGSQGPQSSGVVCFFHQSGTCRFGPGCRDLHPERSADAMAHAVSQLPPGWTAVPSSTGAMVLVGPDSPPVAGPPVVSAPMAPVAGGGGVPPPSVGPHVVLNKKNSPTVSSSKVSSQDARVG